jgi:hypothetical protein
MQASVGISSSLRAPQCAQVSIERRTGGGMGAQQGTGNPL